MAQNDEHHTDAQSIKPVSSLLSHFEGLKAPPPARPPKPTERSGIPVRASFDTPRSDSPWSITSDTARVTPPTPGIRQRDADGFKKPGHTRPMSMHIASSPQLTPAVNIVSPRSPHRIFFYRSSSRSPERLDNTPFGKARELIASHSSRSSSRPPSPTAAGNVSPKSPGLRNPIPMATPSSDRSMSPSRQPPPSVNRAEKPKIPAKPLGISHNIPVTGRLTPETGPSAAHARVSPFSTPPSSEGTPSPKEWSGPILISESRKLSPDSAIQQSRDPRFLGFNTTNIPTRANTVGERKVVKDSAPPKRHVSEQVYHSPSPPTPSQPRDARQFGIGNSTIRAVQEARPIPPKLQMTQTSSIQTRDARDSCFVSRSLLEEPLTLEPASFAQPSSPPVRDARQFGFSSTPIREDRPDLPARRSMQIPPPRPSEESKNLLSKKPPPPPSIITEKPRQASSPYIPQNASVSNDMRFPPPPKRNTFNRDAVNGPPEAPARASLTVKDLYEDSDDHSKTSEPNKLRTDYPDATQTNRRPPFTTSGEYEIKTRSDGRTLDICGKYLCVSGYNTRVYDMSTGEQIMSLNHGETVKVSSVKFKPSAAMDEEGSRLWIGNNIGELQEIDVDTHSVIGSSHSHNRREVLKILRHRQHLWTLDDDGKLFVWRADESGEPNLKYSHIAHKTPRGHTFSVVIKDQLWLATGKEVRVYRPGNEANFNVLPSPLAQSGVGDVTSGTYSKQNGGRVYFGHTDGKVSIYSTADYKCVGVIKASDYKINALSFVGDQLWTAYKTGKIYVYDTSTTPWKVKKDWHAHAGPVSNMLLDPSSVWTLSKLQLVTAGHDDVVRMWDATLEEDWMESVMQERDVDYCSFRELRAVVVSWNCGAVDPTALRNDFIADAIHSEDPPEILAFGFQEVVDLEDKAITAKSILGFTKKKDVSRTDQHQSRVYRAWRDSLARCIDRYTGAQYTYTEIQTSHLVGLFQCIFIRREERSRVTSLSVTNVKCGMGGHLGNKGALVTRFVLDDSSLCFINCHLAAGQTQTSSRNNDIATILESETLPPELNRQLRSSLFVGGGDGTQILDHEICILNGDLNYRIDTIPRDTVIRMIKNNELAKLMDRDQLLVCRRRIAGFRLAPFIELPITFAPTYKYDVGTDNYDSSEKKRAPAWCDRLLFRGPGRVKQIEYRRHEVKFSDHRPVSGIFKIRIKKIDPHKQERVRYECSQRFQAVKKDMCEDVCISYLVETMGLSEKEAKRMIAR